MLLTPIPQAQRAAIPQPSPPGWEIRRNHISKPQRGAIPFSPKPIKMDWTPVLIFSPSICVPLWLQLLFQRSVVVFREISIPHLAWQLYLPDL